MERGHLSGASDSVLDGIARALQLDEAERDHLMDLARACEKAPARCRQTKSVGGNTGRAAGHRRDHRGAGLGTQRPTRSARREPTRFVYLDPASPDFFQDWERAADDIAAVLRSEAGRNPYDKQLIELIGELSTRSEDFRTRWAAHNVRFHRRQPETSG